MAAPAAKAATLEATGLPAGHSLLLHPPSPRGGGRRAAEAPAFAMPPTGAGALSARLRSFLPAMQAANAALAQRVDAEGAAAVDIEALAHDSAERVIEMDLAVAELGDSSSSDGSSSDSDVSDSECAGGGGGEGGDVGRRGGARGRGRGRGGGGAAAVPARRPRILEVGDGGALADGGGGAGGASGAGAAGDGGAAAEAPKDDELPAGVWVTDAAVLQRCKRDVMRMLLAEAPPPDGAGDGDALRPLARVGGAGDGGGMRRSGKEGKEES